MSDVWRQSVDRPRDFVGYGRKRPDPRWPGNAPIAVNFAINYEEPERSRLMSIGFHPRITGQPALAGFLDHILKHDRVWIRGRLDVARHWHNQHAPGEVLS